MNALQLMAKPMARQCSQAESHADHVIKLGTQEDIYVSMPFIPAIGFHFCNYTFFPPSNPEVLLLSEQNRKKKKKKSRRRDWRGRSALTFDSFDPHFPWSYPVYKIVPRSLYLFQ